jgi:micrococcal nuclease
MTMASLLYQSGIGVNKKIPIWYFSVDLYASGCCAATPQGVVARLFFSAGQEDQAMFGYLRNDDVGVTDGDTIWHMSAARKFRLIGYDSPERGARAKSEHEAKWAEDATKYLEETIAGARTIRIRPKVFGKRRTRNGDRLAKLYIDGVDVKQLMIDARMGVEWTGGKRPDWEAMER